MAHIQKYEEYLEEINRCIDENDLDKKRLREEHSRIVGKIIELRAATNKADKDKKREVARSFASEDSAFVIV